MQCPLTLDYNAFKQTLEAVDTEVIQKGGTDIAAAIRTAQRTFLEEDNFKFIILITDGEDLSEAGVVQARDAGKENVTIYTVGVGSKEGELIPIKKGDGSTEYIRDSEGKVVKTRLDEETLNKIASATGGFYVPLGARGEGLERVYQAGLNTIPKQELTSALRKVPLERFQVPLAVVILLLMIEPTISNRRENMLLKRRLIERLRRASMLVFLLLMIFPGESRLEASEGSRGYRAYINGDYEESVKHFEKARRDDLKNPHLPYNLGLAYYKAKNYEAGLHALNDSLSFHDIEHQQDTLYNLGNTYYRLGEEGQATNPQQTIDLWEEALEHYESAMDLDEGDVEARENYEYVKRRLEELKQQEEQKKQQDNEKKEEDKKNEDQDKEEEKGEDGGDGTKEEEKDGEEPRGEKENEQNGDEDERKGGGNKGKNEEQRRDQGQQGSGEPRKISKEEARQLLRALENNEKRLPAISVGEDEGSVGDDVRNW